MAQKDLAQKILEDYADVFADIVNNLLFHGEKLLLEEDIIDGPTGSQYKSETGKLRGQERDCIKYDRNNSATLAVFGIENQSRIDHDMVFRVMGYDYASYRKQIDDENESKKSTLFTKKKAPVFTLVLNFGLKKWDGPKDVMSALDMTTPYAKYYEETVSNPKINVVDIAFLSKDVREKFTSDFKLVAEYFCAVRENRLKELRFSTQEINHVEEFMDLLEVFAKDKRYGEYKPVIAEMKRKGEIVNMCTLLDYAANEGLEKGLKKGLKEGREEGLKEAKRTSSLKMLKKGYAYEDIAEINEVSVEQVIAWEKQA